MSVSSVPAPVEGLSKTQLLKLKLKKWEKSFFDVNGRKPERRDIELASSDVKVLYKKYWATLKVASNTDAWNSSLKKSVETAKPVNVVDTDAFRTNLLTHYNDTSFVDQFCYKKKKRPKVETPILVEMVPHANENVISHGPKEIQDNCNFDPAAPSELVETISPTRESEPEEQTKSNEYVPKKKAPARRKKAVKENFLRLDLKRKSFASKGYKKFNVQKYKRKQWKQNQRDKCFKCGEKGHWAANCPTFDLPGNAAEVAAQPDDLPTNAPLIDSEDQDMPSDNDGIKNVVNNILESLASGGAVGEEELLEYPNNL